MAAQSVINETNQQQLAFLIDFVFALFPTQLIPKGLLYLALVYASYAICCLSAV